MVDASDLAKEIRESARTGKPVRTELRTSSRIIARVTDGIYREPWAAFRELVANSFDADATRVDIQTNAPTFTQVTVSDDGSGMNVDIIAHVFRNIGGSSKRTAEGSRLGTTAPGSPDMSPGGRPLIGKIGIGLFAVAQLTQHFQIVTKQRDEAYRTSATIVLDTFSEDYLARDAVEEYQPGNVTIISEPVPSDEVAAHGTTITLYDLREEIRWDLQSRRRWRSVRGREAIERDIKDLEAQGRTADAKALRPPTEDAYLDSRPKYHVGLSMDGRPGAPFMEKSCLPWKGDPGSTEAFRSLLDAAADTTGRERTPASLEHFDNYLRTIWQLSLSLPLAYVSRHPFDISGADGMHLLELPALSSKSAVEMTLPDGLSVRDALDLHAGRDLGLFAVTFDGLQLSRPVDLPDRLRTTSRLTAPVLLVGRHSAVYDADELDRVGGALDFEMYLYWNSKIVPKETNGVLIRIHEASGILFDPTFLGYKVSEQTRHRQITCEIFIRRGLDSALNIDRESFNYSHPHFLYVQAWLHRSIRLLVNWLKLTSSSLITQERGTLSQTRSELVEAAAVSVWNRRRGEASDPPDVTVVVNQPALPAVVAGQDLTWTLKSTDDAKAAPDGLAKAVATVLSAYRALDALTSGDRASLIADLLLLFSQVSDARK